MGIILKKELAWYFRSGSGLIIAGLFFLVHGIFFSIYTLQYGLADYGYTISALETSFLAIIPLLTMGLAAGERSAKTDVLLFTAPLTSRDIVLGKYGAAVILGALLTSAALLFPLLIVPQSVNTAGQTITASIGYFFTWCGFSAMGLCVSCGARSKISAGAQTFCLVLVFMLLDTFIPLLPRSLFSACILSGGVILCAAFFVYRATASRIFAAIAAAIGSCAAGIVCIKQPLAFCSFLPDAAAAISITLRQKQFTSGIIDSKAILFFVIWIVCWLCGSTAALELQRQKKGE